MKPYFYIYRPNYPAPTVRHPTLAEAAAEAERLAIKHPEAQFEILQCVGVTRAVAVQTFWLDGVTPP